MTEAGAVIISGLVAIFAAALGYLLQRKDQQQQDQIMDLYRKHEADSTQLQHLELKVASDYHDKREIEGIVRGLKEFLNEKFSNLEASINGRRSADRS